MHLILKKKVLKASYVAAWQNKWQHSQYSKLPLSSLVPKLKHTPRVAIWDKNKLNIRKVVGNEILTASRNKKKCLVFTTLLLLVTMITQFTKLSLLPTWNQITLVQIQRESIWRCSNPLRLLFYAFLCFATLNYKKMDLFENREMTIGTWISL